MTLVIWSGGCDSTLALLQVAKKASHGEPARALSVVHDQVAQGPEERQARKKIRKVFKKRGLPIEYAEVTIKHAGDFAALNSGITQPVIWIMTAITYLHNKEDLVTGYIRTDDAFHYRIQLVNTFIGARDLAGKNGDIKFPLEWWKKSEVIKELQKEKLISLVWWCETPEKGRPCGRCTPCTTMEMGRKELAFIRKRDSLKRSRPRKKK